MIYILLFNCRYIVSPRVNLPVTIGTPPHDDATKISASIGVLRINEPVRLGFPVYIPKSDIGDPGTFQYSTVQYISIQYSTVQRSIVHYITLHNNTRQ